MKQSLLFGILTGSIAGLLTHSALADPFGSGGNQFTIDFVTVGNPGNADDRAFDNTTNTPGDPNDDEFASPYGGVAYTFRIGTYEISEEMITKATNLGMLNVTAGAWTGNQPAANTTWYEAAAFVNWLNATTGHQAAYQLNETNTALTLWTSAQAWQLGGQNRYRHKDAYYFLPSEDEWYKAAFHKNDGVTANYWDYATGSNSIPIAVASGTGGGTAVYDRQSIPAGMDNDGGLNAYGTRGQNGNVWEWQESASDGINNSPSENRAVLGGDWYDTEDLLRSSTKGTTVPSSSSDNIGFRVASVVPEPSSTALLLSAGLFAFARRRRRAACP